MNITIFHYHLNPGGVTRIIESQVAAVRQNYPEMVIQIVTGYCENMEYYNNLNVKVNIIKEINYLQNKEYNINELEDIFNTIYTGIKSLISDNEIFHVHNLNLGKNPVFTLVINKFLNKNHLIVNHAHDFAEDRPQNIEFLNKIITQFGKTPKNILYPDNKKYAVCVLNKFDYKRVCSYGITNSRIFLFPNPVFIPEIKSNNSKIQSRNKIVTTFNFNAQKSIITYPVRVIRRKNIGELILLAKLFEDKCSFLVTMAPRNPEEIKFYDNWKNFCIENNINIIFEAGDKLNFETIVSGSDYCITTSIKEGFGMSFLEPWLMGTPVIGRNLNLVTDDIKSYGIQFPMLYNKLKVPFFNDNIDFKELAPERQQAVILEIFQGTLNKNTIFTLNNYLTNFPPEVSQSIIINNQNIIKKEFSLNKYAERLFKAYRAFS
jgi:hypothetical protein